MHALLLMLQPVSKLVACLAGKSLLSVPAWIASGHVDAGNKTLMLLHRPRLQPGSLLFCCTCGLLCPSADAFLKLCRSQGPRVRHCPHGSVS